MSVVQIVERMENCEVRQIVRAQVTQTGNAQLDQGRAEVRPGKQHPHQKNGIAVNESRRRGLGLTAPAVEGESVAAGSKGQDNEDVDRRHFIVIKVAEAAQQSFVKNEKQSGCFCRETGQAPDGGGE